MHPQKCLQQPESINLLLFTEVKGMLLFNTVKIELVEKKYFSP